MTASRRHPEKALSAVRVRSIKQPGRYADGNGLYLVVDPSGAKRWLLRTVVHGRRRDIGLGSLRLVTLAEARETASELRKTARDGGDPIQERRKAQLVVPSFEEAARQVHAEHSKGWKNSKHRAQWISSLQAYAFPVFGAKRIDQVDTPDVLRALSPIWLVKPETARRVRQRIGAVLDWAKAAGLRSGDNPIDGISKGLPKQNDRQIHHPAMPYQDVPDFVAEFARSHSRASAHLALEFLILTAARTGEVIGATWEEVDLECKTWTIPGTRMKSGVEHRVPLSDRCVEVLQQARKLTEEGDFVFPGKSRGKPLSNMTFAMILRRMKKKVTAHGFRSSFRDWAAEQTNFTREVSEMALAHTIKDKVEAAYRRGDLFEKRRELMTAWTAFVTTGPGNVVPIKAARRRSLHTQSLDTAS